MAKVKSNNFKDTHGYSRVGGMFKSAETKSDLTKRKVRLNAYSPDQNKDVQETLKRANDVPGALKNPENKMGEYGQWEGAQRHKKVRLVPKFRK
jgi:hypothetical protein